MIGEILAYIIIGYISLIIIIGEFYFSFTRHRRYPIDPLKFAARLEFKNKEGEKIVGWFRTKRHNKAKIAIVVHGHFDNAGMMFERYAEVFTSNNWDVLAIDLRNHGMSDNIKPITYGSLEFRDVLCAINWVFEKKEWHKVVVFGTSMGSISSLLAVVNTDYKIDGLILDSPFVSVGTTFKLNMKKHHLPINLFFKPLYHYLEFRYKRYGFSLDYFPDIMEQIGLAYEKTKMFIARGVEDREVSIEDFEGIKKITPDATHMSVPEMEHSRLYKSKQFCAELTNWISTI